jgi:gamma-glutamyltranspeptidase/glutathione hydrolase/leukotriene-C4 hydrolase
LFDNHLIVIEKPIFFFRLRSKYCYFFGGLIIFIAVAALFFEVYSEYFVEHQLPDPEFPLPPSYLPMGLYSKVAVVSNGGPCAQIGV